MKSYLDNTLTIPGNIKFQTPDGVFELKGVTNVALMEKEQKIKEWGDTNNRNLIQVVGIFPNGIGDEKIRFHCFPFSGQDRIKIEDNMIKRKYFLMTSVLI